MNKLQALHILKKEVSQCTKCEEICQIRTQTVFGNGNIDSKIVFVGEGPGRDEDKQGVPFCGRAGTLLNSILDACNIKREDVYVCNILKCRPPNNRTPLPQEIENCSKFFNLQIKILNPKYIVCLGNTAAQALLKTDITISKLRKTWFQYENPPIKSQVLVTYHPAFALRNQNAKKEIYEDLQLLLADLANS